MIGLYHSLTFTSDRCCRNRHATAATAAGAITAAAIAAIFSRAGLVNDHVAAVIFLPVKLGDGRIRLIIRGHLDKTEPTRTPRFAVINDIGRFDCTGGTKMFLQILTRHTK